MSRCSSCPLVNLQQSISLPSSDAPPPLLVSFIFPSQICRIISSNDGFFPFGSHKLSLFGLGEASLFFFFGDCFLDFGNSIELNTSFQLIILVLLTVIVCCFFEFASNLPSINIYLISFQITQKGIIQKGSTTSQMMWLVFPANSSKYISRRFTTFLP